MNESMNDFEKNMYQEIRMLREKFSILKIENNKLKSQFEWKSAGIPPDVDGLYVATKRDESPRWDKSYHLVRFKNGKWKLDIFAGGYVHSYFNVPIPEPNEE